MNSNKFMYVSMYPRLKQLQNKLFANIGMLQLTVKFFRCKLPYKFHEDITVCVREEARSEEVAETCAERVLEVSGEHGQPFGLEKVSLFASKPRSLSCWEKRLNILSTETMCIFVETASAAIPTQIAIIRMRKLLHPHLQPHCQHVHRSRGSI